MIERIFGAHRSWQRQVCMVLSLVVAVLGIVIMVVGDVAEGAMIAIVGIASGMILSRMVEATASRAATSSLLGDIARMGGPAGAQRAADGAGATASRGADPDTESGVETDAGAAEAVRTEPPPGDAGLDEHDLSGR